MKAPSERAAQLRQIPSVDELLLRPAVAGLARRAHRTLLVEVIREVLDDVRAELVGGKTEAAAPDLPQLETRIAAELDRTLALSLRPVINATGVILHTNLGRAPLPPAAIEHLRRAATQYSNLEYDLASGARGKRDVHTARLLARLAGAPSAIVVNNNAAAIFLVLSALAKGAEVIVSRGELVEIGDGFRIPDIMAESGAILREVGTTNRTSLADYERAINDRTRLLLRVHPSNFRMVGFTARPSLEELAALGRRFSLPVFEDLGSGCLVDLSAHGFQEPVVRASLEAGASLVCFSGDKLLGGPQAGVIAGSRELVERIRRNPLFRALRVDKLTIAALEATLNAYLRGAYDELPALRMIGTAAEEIGRRAETFLARLRDALTQTGARAEILPGFSVIGGGSTPGEHLPTRLIAITSPRHSAAQLEERLRLAGSVISGERSFSSGSQNPPEKGTFAPEASSSLLMPVIARVEDDRLVLDLRTVFPEDESALAAALLAAF